MDDVNNTTESRGSLSQSSARMRSRPGTRHKTSATCGRKDQLSHASIRQLQAKIEAENQQVQELIKPLLDTENGFIKELDNFLSQQDVAELRRRELLHKHWTEHVWFPLQKRVEERVSTCSPVKVKRWQSLHSDYQHHCNSKIKTVCLKDTLNLYPCERLNDKKTPPFWKTENKCTLRKPQELSQNYNPLEKCGPSQVNYLPKTSSNHPASTSIKIPRKDETEHRKSGSTRCSE
ncbi:protein FAM228A [Melanotaenia boesemani]|uniref:protein FAM228A n=1 Tax=Melanotaenia boesemani TaxID=1250792 RepID=UPI001C051FE9|nr:protein FAM228A [Melanotaenia boesemani]